MPTDVDGWVERLSELMEEVDSKTVMNAYQGQASAKATIQAWAVEMQAAAVFIATYAGTVQVNAEALLEIANTIIDTVQAILLALGIIYLLKKLKRKSHKGAAILEIVVTEKTARSELGDKTNPIPSKTDVSRAESAAFIMLRLNWATHFMLTMMQALKLQGEINLDEDQELVWKAHLDAKTCSICKFMHNKKSVNGDFLSVILKEFPKYTPYVNWMGFPHAHPRCRCVAVVE